VIRIARYAGIIAEGIGLDQEMVDRIELASTLHDVGKIGVADEVLSAAENLTAAQEQALRGHVEIGHKLLEHCASANLVMAAEICLSHHERYDGRGYPRGLSGRDIPLPARIVAVAEAFEAFTMSSPADDVDRVATALRGIREESGTAYDPVCVEALSVEADKARRILGTFADSA
jgi:response regulator RpfG family c-di-GMP phosphodiesterase